MPDAIAASVGSGQVIDALQYDFGSGQVVAVGAAAASSAAFVVPYTAAVLTSTTNCWYSIGATAVAHGAASEYLPAGLKLKVKFAAGQTISVIQDTLAGFLSITPASNPSFGALLLDAVGLPAAAAYSLRQLTNAYTGPAVNVRRSSDNTTQNIGFTATGDLNVAAFNAFVGAGQGFVATWYDQSGNANNAVQATAANQPQLVTSVANLNGRPALLGANASAIALLAPASASLTNIFASGGYVSSVVNFATAGTQSNRWWGRLGGPYGQLTNGPMPNSISFYQNASTTNGSWGTPNPTPVGLGDHQIDVQYSSASLANVPTVAVDNVTQTNIGSVQPVGTISSDAAASLFLLGNNSNSGLPGHLAEFLMFASIPTAIPSIRTNQKAYWGTP